MNRDDIIAFVIGIEGGYVNNPTDPGGATNFGITQRYLDHVHASGAAAGYPTSVADLTSTQAAALYQANEWTTVQGDQLPWRLALLAFDTAVNEGPHRAITILQQALGVTADGVLGPATLAAAASAGPLTCRKFAAHRGVAYAQLYATEGQFELGWMDRLLKVYTQAIL